MPFRNPQSRLLSIVLFTVIGLISCVMIAAIFWLPLEQESQSDWAHFIGRFHILFLHLPIGVISLIPIFELLIRIRYFRSLKPSANFLLLSASATSLLAVFFGMMLGFAESYQGELISAHLWKGVAMSICIMFAGALRLLAVNEANSKLMNAYFIALIASLGFMTSASHDGGSMVHGKTYLFEHNPFKEPRAVVPLREQSVFAAHIQPILEDKCVSCHNAEKTKGSLVLNTYEGIMKGGEYGPSVVPGKANESELIVRVLLPHDDEEFMPPDGKPPLSDEENDLIQWWINQGASNTLKLVNVDIETAPMLLAQATIPDAPMLTDMDLQQLKALESKYKLIIRPVSHNLKDGLRISAINATKTLEAKALKALEPWISHIRQLNLDRTQLGDEAILTLAKFNQLKSLSLAKTRVSGARIGELETLDQLISLNLYGTPFETANLSEIAKLSKLKVLYLESIQNKEALADLKNQSPKLNIITDDVLAMAQTKAKDN